MPAVVPVIIPPWKIGGLCQWRDDMCTSWSGVLDMAPWFECSRGGFPQIGRSGLGLEVKR